MLKQLNKANRMKSQALRAVMNPQGEAARFITKKIKKAQSDKYKEITNSSLLS